jgi:hypothetical protein
MIDAYLDESGIHDGAAVCVVAGYYAGRGQWRKFEADWRKLLQRFGVPMEKFHAKDLLKRAGFFHDSEQWTDDKHKRFLVAAGETVTRWKVQPISSSVVVGDFNSFSEIHRRFLTGATLKDGRLVSTGSPNKPYFVPFIHCVRRVASYAPAGGKAHFFFGLNRTFKHYAVALYAEIKGNPINPHVERLGDPSFPLASETPQLQAADLLAYLTYKFAQERAAANDWSVSPQGLLLTCLSRTVENKDHTYYDEPTMRSSIQEIHNIYSQAGRDLSAIGF